MEIPARFQIEHWWHALALFGAVLAITALIAPIEQAFKWLIFIAGLGVFFIGVGEWINHPIQQRLIPPHAMFPAGVALLAPGHPRVTLEVLDHIHLNTRGPDMRFEKQTLTGVVTFDDNDFVECTFKDCTIQYHGGRYSFVGVKFEGHTKLAIRGAAAYTLSFLKMLHRECSPELVQHMIETAADAMSLPAGTKPS
jgi:hypothetical protein